MSSAQWRQGFVKPFVRVLRKYGVRWNSKTALQNSRLSSGAVQNGSTNVEKQSSNDSNATEKPANEVQSLRALRAVTSRSATSSAPRNNHAAAASRRQPHPCPR